MKRVVALSIVLALAAWPAVHAIGPNEGAAARLEALSLTPVRARWPIAREPGGQWGVVGEVLARHQRADPVTVRAVEVALHDDGGRLLWRQRYDTPSALAGVLRVAAGEQPASWRPPGTTAVLPGERAVVFVAELVPARPARAVVTIVSDGEDRVRVGVPLDVYVPTQRFRWPTGPSQEPWIVTSTPGTPPHSQGGAVLDEGRLFISQRFALDLRQIDFGLNTHPPGSTCKEDYYAWGEDVVSMARGRVVAVVQDDPDYEIGAVIPPTQHPAGNYVVVQHGPASFSVYAHLQHRSARVAMGEVVNAGDRLALVGNSGSSSEPHLHVHTADRWQAEDGPVAAFFLSQGVPSLLWGAHVLRDDRWIPLRGTMPTEFDIVLSTGSE